MDNKTKPVKTADKTLFVDANLDHSKRVELLVDDPLLHKFRLEDFGVDTQDFIEIKHTFENLPDDRYELKLRQVEFLKTRFPQLKDRLSAFLADYYASDDAIAKIQDVVDQLSPPDRQKFAKIEPRRKRTIARFEAELRPDGKIDIKRVPAGTFIQYNAPKGSPLSLPRTFSESSAELTEEPGFKRLVLTMCHEIFCHSKAHSLAIAVHQVTMHATPELPFVLPEGIHQDGTDFIVSAIPIILEDVVIPKSTVYDLNKVPVFETQLNVGEGLFHNDKRYWHSVGDLHSKGPSGWRGTLGFDIRLAG
jgi:hypothetical protein